MFKKVGTTMVALVLATAAAAAERKNLQVFNEVATQINRYPQFTIFDDINVAVDDGVVTLTGKVTMPFKRNDIGTRVARIDGVKEVLNRVEVLPVSQFDDDLRYRIARAIYGNPTFWDYAAMANPPIHIIVDRGRVTLTGVVRSNVDRMLARSLATSFGAFEVKNELRTDAEVRAELERVE